MAIRIEYIEDGDFRDTIKPALINGYKREDVELGIRKDFQRLRQDLESGNLADVYILDNEIYNDDDYGVDMAFKIKKRALDLGKEVLVISLLCSNPTEVINEHGTRLKEEGIPVRYKSTDAMVVFFYVGSCIREGRNIDFSEWVTQEGIALPRTYGWGADSIQGEILPLVEKGSPSIFYESIHEFVEANREVISEQLSPLARHELSRQFPELGRGIEAK